MPIKAMPKVPQLKVGPGPDLAAARHVVRAMPQSGITDARRLGETAYKETEAMRYLVPNSTGLRDYGVHAGEPLAHRGAQADANNWMVLHGGTAIMGNRGGMTLQETAQDGTRGTAFGDLTAAGAGASALFAAGGGDTLRAGGSMFTNGNMVGLGGNTTLLSGSGGFLGAGAAAFIAANSEFKCLDLYKGDDPQLQGHYLAEFQRKATPGVTFDLTGGAHSFGLGGKLVLQRTKLSLCRVYVPEESLRHTLRSRDTQFTKMRNVATGLRLLPAPVTLPKLVQVLDRGGSAGLRVGESVTLQVQGLINIGFSVGAYGVRAGVYGTYQGESEMTLRRLDAHSVELVQAPKNDTGTSLNLDVMLLAEAYVSKSTAKVYVEGHRFDLRLPSAQEALRAALRGEGPFSPKATSVQPGDAAALAAKTRHDAALPPGVTRTFIEKSSRPVRVAGGGMPKPFFMGDKSAGLGGAASKFSEDSVLTQGDAALSTHTRGVGLERQKGMAGTQQVVQTASIQRVHAFGETGAEVSRCDGVMAELSWVHQRVSKPALDQARERFGRVFGLKTQPFRHPRARETYGVTAKRFFSTGELVSLGYVSEVSLNLACERYPNQAQKLTDLVKQVRILRALSQHFARDLLMTARAELVQNYLHGDDGQLLGALHFVLGDDAQALQLQTASSKFDKNVNYAKQVQFTWSEDLPAPKSRAMARATHKTAKAEKKLDQAILMANDDQFLRTHSEDELLARVKIAGDLRQGIRTLRKALSLQGDDSRVASARIKG